MLNLTLYTGIRNNKKPIVINPYFKTVFFFFLLFCLELGVFNVRRWMLYLNVLIWICRCFQRVWCFFFVILFLLRLKIGIHVKGSRCNIEIWRWTRQRDRIERINATRWNYTCNIHANNGKKRVNGGFIKTIAIEPILLYVVSKHVQWIYKSHSHKHLLFYCLSVKKRISVFRCYVVIKRKIASLFLGINAFILFYFYFERNF